MSLSSIQDLVEGRIDFAGQALVEQIIRYALIVLTVAAFSAGFVVQDISVTFGLFGLGTCVIALVIVPPWPVFNQHPVAWLPNITPAETKTGK